MIDHYRCNQIRFSGRVSVEKECIICMDAERACLLSPCHHLATCQVNLIVIVFNVINAINVINVFFRLVIILPLARSS